MRVPTVAVVLAVLSLFVTSTVAQAANGATVETSTVSFVLTSAGCSQLPAGTTVTGRGTQKSVTVERTDASGITTITNATHAAGTATDQAGNVYVFQYSNEFRLSNTVADPGVFSGLMTDAFALAGPGPARLQNGFVAELTAPPDFSTVQWKVRSVHGDPISFASGPVVAHCDPL
jgi:hypothetical protein